MSTSPVPLGIVVPMRNEATAIPHLLASLEQQTCLASIGCLACVDGGSEDSSRTIVASWQSRLPCLQLLDNPRHITPVAFNLGVEACLQAGVEAVLFVSAHSWLASGFVAQLQHILQLDEADIIGAVHQYPPPKSAFEQAVQSYCESRLGRRLGWWSRLSTATPTDVAFCPTIRRRVFDRVGLFDETMVRNQDNDFTARARAAGARVVTYPSLRYTYIPPQSFARHLRQMHGNGVWVGQRLHAHSPRHFAPALFWGCVLVSLCVGWLTGHWRLGLSIALCALYLVAIIGGTLSWLPQVGRGVYWLPALFVSGHLAYALGTYRSLLTLGLRQCFRTKQGL
jgi:glycosyltransferase involved in cell wall biosynthesis